MSKYAVGIELEDITGEKWGQLERGLNELIKVAGFNGKISIKPQAHLADKKAVVAFCLETD